jgi:hypothetical protein
MASCHVQALMAGTHHCLVAFCFLFFIKDRDYTSVAFTQRRHDKPGETPTSLRSGICRRTAQMSFGSGDGLADLMRNFSASRTRWPSEGYTNQRCQPGFEFVKKIVRTHAILAQQIA